ncbi:hypothetical protein POSPLADRAFT_1146055 [Postia placenta MAD-698-R-SB12]|uniref:Uncharacterized protein n=1 Tax=Postia placenta MAD-698-R-SB12 TaxID=670580 RepID=A0A1X6MXD5_9APHY|nr:hypothetical protein POSPLADRAFT_1146055 [Postia placenta MAD-698-R-SB12]OSX60883.1 hypothetical protein POSPLADRAFT_1146055 [Postia placenta MAD-698-R-SB12]
MLRRQTTNLLRARTPAPRTSRHALCATLTQHRTLATSSPLAWARSNSRISTVFSLLIALGVASTAYGVYEFYSAFTMWPQEVRGDLRTGIKAKNQGDFERSERYLRRAYETALALPLSAFASEPYLKLSGIAIALASVLEAAERAEPAYEVYTDALSRLRAAQAAAPGTLSGPERMRAVALAMKLGEMAEAYQLPVEEEERWLTWAVEELLRIVRDEGQNRQLVVGDAVQDAGVPFMLAELDVPPWVTKTDMGAPLEALGRFYSREGNVEYAIPLYLQAISLLVPPASSKKKATVEERCRGGQLMNNLAELSIRGEPTDAKRKQAEAWARQGLATIESTKALGKGSPEELMLCDEALAAVLFNLGSLLEMAGDTEQSRDLFQKSLDQAKNTKMREGIIQSQTALRRLDRASKRTSTPAQDDKSGP